MKIKVTEFSKDDAFNPCGNLTEMGQYLLDCEALELDPRYTDENPEHYNDGWASAYLLMPETKEFSSGAILEKGEFVCIFECKYEVVND